MTTLEEKHLSGITFDWVRIRELRFVDNPASDQKEEARDLVVTLTISAKVGADRSWCRAELRVRVSPPERQPEMFQSLTANVEGHFSVRGTPTVDLEEFARRQGPVILMPFVREAISRVTTGSRLGQVLLPPVNVLALTEEVAASPSLATESKQ